ncbi:AraC family transcriptional regulator [Thalassospira sp. UBA1131]|uniref:AraC family transcriptional regulator n=1 Tax=Thalassospira sp. UBA1131 TaxID=1947672 RepID=UPI0025E4F25B|nr:AraC family transcriptional regulator [Thalassospira sp. UBA1131]
MDPLSDVLSLLRPKSYVSSGFSAGGEWAIEFNKQHDRIKCYSVVSGTAWLAVKDGPPPTCLKEGDCFVLPSGKPFILASDLSVPTVDSSTLFPPPQPGGTVACNGGGDFFLVGSRFAVHGKTAPSLLRMLPEIVHIRKDSERAALHWSIQRMITELNERKPGSDLIAQHLAHMILVQALRIELTENSNHDLGWFSALADPGLGLAIQAIHSDPARKWSLQELSACAGMSRSIFAQRFKERVGETPIEYLTRWRMLLAVDRLENSTDPVSSIALAVGYEAESAFSTAFKRVMGASPRQYSFNRQGSAF